MADVDVAALRREHVADQLGLCVDCAQSWPCTTAALLARLEAAEAVVAAARQASEEYDTGTDCPCDCGLCQIARTLAVYDRVTGTGGAHG